MGGFDYSLPSGMEGKIGPGHLVTVPFGKQIVQGVVLELLSRPWVAETKPVLDLLDPLPVLTGVQLELAKQLAGSTLNPLAAMIDMLLPSGLSQQADQIIEIRDQGAVAGDLPGTSIQTRLLKLLSEKGPLHGRQIDRHFSRVDWRKTAQYLVRSGVLTSQSVLPPPTVRPKFIRTAQLAVPPEQAEAALPDLGKTEATPNTPPVCPALPDAGTGCRQCFVGVCQIGLYPLRFAGTGSARVDCLAGNGESAGFIGKNRESGSR